MRFKDRVIIDEKILDGKPVIKGTRLSVEFLLELLTAGWTIERILENYPQLEREDILAALEYSLETLRNEKVYAI